MVPSLFQQWHEMGASQKSSEYAHIKNLMLITAEKRVLKEEKGALGTIQVAFIFIVLKIELKKKFKISKNDKLKLYKYCGYGFEPVIYLNYKNTSIISIYT